MSLDGTVALVSGASAGIGRAYALALAGQGATVIAVARSTDGGPAALGTLSEVVASGAGLDGAIHARPCDLRDEDAIRRLVDDAVSQFGGIHVLVNNAGIYPKHDTWDITRANWDATMDLNLYAPFALIRQVAPVMIRQRRGSIVNITAKGGDFFPKGHPGHEGLLLYALSKAGLNRLTTFMAEELREHDIAVNALSPGVVRSTRWQNATADAGSALGTVAAASPDTLGPALLHLAAQTAETMTGKVLHTNEFGKSWP